MPDEYHEKVFSQAGANQGVGERPPPLVCCRLIYWVVSGDIGAFAAEDNKKEWRDNKECITEQCEARHFEEALEAERSASKAPTPASDGEGLQGDGIKDALSSLHKQGMDLPTDATLEQKDEYLASILRTPLSTNEGWKDRGSRNIAGRA